MWNVKTKHILFCSIKVFKPAHIGIDADTNWFVKQLLLYSHPNNSPYVPVSVRQDVKPGVSMVKRVKEALKRETQQKENNIKNRQKTYKEQEKESREAALESSISNNNRGFALLQKMGYKAGQGLGKQGKFLPFWSALLIIFCIYCGY